MLGFSIPCATIQQKPDEVSAYNMLAWSLATVRDSQLRNPDEAVQLATKAVELEPANGGVHNTLGVAYYRAGKWQEAITSLQKSVTLASGGDANDWFFLAMAHWQIGEQEQARDWFHKAVDWTKSKDSQDKDLLRFWAEAAALLSEELPPNVPSQDVNKS